MTSSLPTASLECTPTLQGAFCGQPAGTVWMWPVEHNAWGPAGTRIIMRPTGAREYVVHDHLGSARLTYDNTGGVVERRSYRAFGVETQSDGEGARTSYIGREKDNESDLGFYGVRMYEPDYGRFLSVDPLWMKYLPLQPYQYAGNDPVGALDPGGDTIVVLQDWDGAIGAGHTAVLIGGDDRGWHLFSKNGGASVVAGESKDPQNWIYFETLSDFKDNAVQFEDQGRYDNAFLIPTTKEQDQKAKVAASEAVKSNYNLFGANCADVASDALSAAGKNPGTKTLVVARTGVPVEGRPDQVPNVRIHDIVKKNGAEVVDERVISPDRKDP